MSRALLKAKATSSTLVNQISSQEDEAIPKSKKKTNPKHQINHPSSKLKIRTKILPPPIQNSAKHLSVQNLIKLVISPYIALHSDVGC